MNKLLSILFWAFFLLAMVGFALGDPTSVAIGWTLLGCAALAGLGASLFSARKENP